MMLFDQDRWQEIFIAIKQNKVRSLLTAFGVFWGIFMLVVMTGAGNGLVNGVSSGTKYFATNSAFVWTQTTTKAYGGFRQGRYWSFTNEDMERIRRQVPEVDLVAPRLEARSGSQGDNVHRGLRSASFTVVGDYPEYNLIDPNEMVYGRFINHMDIKNRRKVCVIGERVYEILFDKDEDPVGHTIRVNGVYFQVVGVFRSLNPNIQMGFDKKESVYIPFTTMQQVYNFGNRVHYFAFTSDEGTSVSEAAEKVMAQLKSVHKISPDDADAIGHFNVEEMVKMMTYLFLGIHLLIWIVGIGTLIAGAVGISNIMVVVVKERTKEIGIQRAIGAGPWRIVSQILTESVFLTLLAGFMGLALGTLLLSGVDAILEMAYASMPADEQVFFRQPQIKLPMALAALAILALTGFVAGLIPAQKAIRIKPIEALRHE